MTLDEREHVIICSRCWHINEVTTALCVKCRHDAGTPAFRDTAENLRNVMRRLLK